MLDQLNGVEERLICYPANIRTILYRTVLDDKILSNRGLHFRFLVVHLLPETHEGCYLHIIRKKFGESELGDKSMTNKSLLDSSKK